MSCIPKELFSTRGFGKCTSWSILKEGESAVMVIRQNEQYGEQYVNETYRKEAKAGSLDDLPFPMHFGRNKALYERLVCNRLKDKAKEQKYLQVKRLNAW
jgi:hypothetical protein